MTFFESRGTLDSRRKTKNMGNKKTKNKPVPRDNAPAQKKEKSVNKTDAFISRWVYLIVFIAALAVYGQSLWFGFVNFDDDVIIVNNFHNLSDISKVSEAFKTDAYFQQKSHYYRPLLTLSFMLDAQTGGKEPWIYHLSNILLHGFVCLLIVYFLKLLKLPVIFLLFAGLFYATHPLLASTVNWVVARNDILAMFFFLFGIITLLKYFSSKKPVLIFLHLISFFLALLSKELAVVFPLIYLLFAILWLEKKLFDKRLFAFYLCWFVAIVFFMLMRNMAIKGVPSSDVLGLSIFIDKLATLPELLQKLFFPSKPNPMPMFDIFRTIFGSIIFVIIIGEIFRNRKSPAFRRFLFGILMFVLLIIPGMFTSQGNFMFDYLESRAFLPALGFLLFIFYIIPNRWLNRKYNYVMTSSFIIIFIYSCVNIYYSRNYKDAKTFYNYAVLTSPNSSIAHSNRGLILNAEGNHKGAIDDYNEALRLHPTNSDVYNNRGLALCDLKVYSAAIADFEHAIKLKPDFAEAFTNLGICYFNMKDFHSAIARFSETIRLKPDIPEAYNNRAGAYFNLGDYNAAIIDYTKAIEFNRLYGDAFINRALARINTGDKDGACSDLNSALQLGKEAVKPLIDKYCRK
ncbi:MAG: hypothetical protein HW421_1356 [Ignavibacteria bacterium]|nr:hypothetical protein [Ignavibacteria bacterium]